MYLAILTRVSLYSLCKFQTQATFEELCREAVNTGPILLSNRSRERITPEKQVLIFI